MSYFKIIEPEATTNLILDPQAGAADPDTSWTINGDGTAPDVIRYTGDRWIGTGCFQFDIDDGTYTQLYQPVAASAVSYTLSARIKRAAGGVVSNTQAQAHFDSADGNWDSITAERDNWYLCVKTATATAGTRNFGVRANEDGLLVDAVQLEQKAYRTTYTDGTLKGNRSDGYQWTGAKHASASTRHSQERTGGRVRDVEDDLGVNSVNSFIGGGEAPEEHHSEELALLPGALYQDSKIQVRFIDLGLTIKSSDGTSQGLHSNRKLLADATRTRRVTPKQPFVFRYTGGPQTMEIDALRVNGLDQGSLNKLIEKTTMRMKCDQPDWRGLGEGAGGLSLPASLANANYIVQRDAEGAWAALGTGMNARVRAIVEADDGSLYVGGNFTTAGGVTVNRIAKWNGSSWSALGTGTAGTIFALAIGPDGSLYAGGTFSTIGGSSIDNIAKWDGSSWSAVGSGTNDRVEALIFGLDGLLYAGGFFTTAGGVTANYIAKWDGAAWSALGVGTNDDVYDLAIGTDGLLYVSGAFTTAGGLTLLDQVAIWNGSVWRPLAGIDLPSTAIAHAVHQSTNGVLYLGFDTSGTATVADTDTISYGGSADTWPRLEVTGPGTLYRLANLTTGKSIYFNLTLLAGEQATLDLSPEAVTFGSTFRPQLIQTIINGSDVGTWFLQSGDNIISLFMTGTTAATEAFLVWRELFEGADG